MKKSADKPSPNHALADQLKGLREVLGNGVDRIQHFFSTRLKHVMGEAIASSKESTDQALDKYREHLGGRMKSIGEEFAQQLATQREEYQRRLAEQQAALSENDQNADQDSSPDQAPDDNQSVYINGDGRVATAFGRARRGWGPFRNMERQTFELWQQLEPAHRMRLMYVLFQNDDSLLFQVPGALSLSKKDWKMMDFRVIHKLIIGYSFQRARAAGHRTPSQYRRNFGQSTGAYLRDSLSEIVRVTSPLVDAQFTPEQIQSHNGLPSAQEVEILNSLDIWRSQQGSPMKRSPKKITKALSKLRNTISEEDTSSINLPEPLAGLLSWMGADFVNDMAAKAMGSVKKKTVSWWKKMRNKSYRTSSRQK